MNSNGPDAMDWLDRAVKWVVVAVMSYWAVYSLVVPVTVWDAQTHDVARLMIARDGGFFHNHGWTTQVQICFPWGFNAVEYPFLFLRFGYSLPSFACFTGALIIIFQLVRKSLGRGAAWWCCLAMLALPTLMFQASSTKNDVAIVFGVFCWYYALGFWLAEKRAVFLGLMALALGFTAGAKSSGVPLAAMLVVYTCWRIGWNKHALGRFALFLTAGMVLFGSAETYINNLITFKALLGPKVLVQLHVNRDGVRGALANGIRYFFGVMNIGIDFANRDSRFPDQMASMCRNILDLAGLNNKGYYATFDDSKFYITKMGVEAASDFGPLGAMAIIYALCAPVVRLKRDAVVKLAGAGLLSLAIICYTTGWQPWNNRFLLLPMVLFTLAFTLGVIRGKWVRAHRGAAWCFFGLLAFSSVVYPCYSYNKGPRDLLLSIRHRHEMETKERIDMLEIVNDIKSLPKQSGPVLVLLYPAADSWILPFQQLSIYHPELDVTTFPIFSPALIEQAKARAAGRRIYILALNRWIEDAQSQGLVLVRKYASPDCGLFELQQAK